MSASVNVKVCLYGGGGGIQRVYIYIYICVCVLMCVCVCDCIHDYELMRKSRNIHLRRVQRNTCYMKITKISNTFKHNRVDFRAAFIHIS